MSPRARARPALSRVSTPPESPSRAPILWEPAPPRATLRATPRANPAPPYAEAPRGSALGARLEEHEVGSKSRGEAEVREQILLGRVQRQEPVPRDEVRPLLRRPPRVSAAAAPGGGGGLWGMVVRGRAGADLAEQALEVGAEAGDLSVWRAHLAEHVGNHYAAAEAQEPRDGPHEHARLEP